jgi:DHA2 family methylenomycin A resistance protein-like MFS transporter
VVQGVGAALLLPGTLAIISHAFQRGGDQARAIGFWAGIGSLALPAGPLLGGALIAAFGWRSIFLVNLPIVLVSGLATVLIVRESRDPQARDLDWVGAALGALFLLATTFAFIEAGRSGAGSPAVVASGLAAVVVLAAFLTFERRKGPDAMLPLALFGRPVFSVANGAAGTMNLCTLGAIFVLTLFLQSVLHYSPLLAGLAALPLFAPLAVLAPLAGRLTSRIGPRLPMGFGFLTAAVGLALLALGGAHSSYLVLLPAFLLWGSGLGLVTPSVVAAAIAAVPRNRAGLASGINNTARQAAGAIGVALAGAIAGKPAAVSSFVTGFHAVALGSACLYALAAIAALALIPGALMPRPWPAGSLPVPRSDD